MNGNVLYMDWEVALIEWLQETLGPNGMAVARFFSFLGGEIVSTLVVIAVLFCSSKEIGRRCSLPLMAAMAWFSMAKNVALRLRPYMVHENVEIYQLTEPDAEAMDVAQQGYSFPSGHSANSVSLYGTLAREFRKKALKALAFAMPLLVGISRVAVGAHYPTDILAGWVIGLLALGFGILMEKTVKKEWVRHLILLATALPGLFFCTSRDYFSTLGLIIGVSAALPFEQKFVHFEETKNLLNRILRVVLAATLYFALDKALKLPFSKEYLDSGELGANLIRTARYAVVLFIVFGIYPMCFRFFPGARKRVKE